MYRETWERVSLNLSLFSLFPFSIRPRARSLGTRMNDLVLTFVTKSYCDVNVHFALNERACFSRKRNFALQLISYEDFTCLPTLQSNVFAISYASNHMKGKIKIFRNKISLSFSRSNRFQQRIHGKIKMTVFTIKCPRALGKNNSLLFFQNKTSFGCHGRSTAFSSARLSARAATSDGYYWHVSIALRIFTTIEICARVHKTTIRYRGAFLKQKSTEKEQCQNVWNSMMSRSCRSIHINASSVCYWKCSHSSA